MSELTDNAVAETAQTTAESAEEKSLALSSMENSQEEDKAAAQPDETAKKEENPGESGAADEDNPDNPAEEEVDFNQIKTPDGFALDKDVMSKVAPVLKELKCSKENAEKIVAAGAEIFNKAIQTQAEAFKKKVIDWEKEVRADEVLGQEENIAIANRAVIEFGNERLTKEIIESGLGNHPAFVRFCYNIGKAICEDQVVTATGSAKASNRNELGEPMLDFKSMD